MLKNDFVTEGKVTNPKLLDVTCRVCQKVKGAWKSILYT